MDCPINTVKARMFPRLVPVLAAPRVGTLATKEEDPSYPGVLLLSLRCGSMTLSSLLDHHHCD